MVNNVYRYLPGVSSKADQGRLTLPTLASATSRLLKLVCQNLTSIYLSLFYGKPFYYLFCKIDIYYIRDLIKDMISDTLIQISYILY